MLGAQPGFLGAHTVNQHANVIFSFFFHCITHTYFDNNNNLFQCAVSNSESHFIVILIYTKCFHKYAHAFDDHGSDNFTGVRTLVVPLDRTLRLLSARLPLHWECSRHDKRLPCEKPFMAHEVLTGLGYPQGPDERPARFVWNGWKIMYCVGQGYRSGRMPEQRGSGIGFAIKSKTFQCWICYSNPVSQKYVTLSRNLIYLFIRELGHVVSIL